MRIHKILYPIRLPHQNPFTLITQNTKQVLRGLPKIISGKTGKGFLNITPSILSIIEIRGEIRHITNYFPPV